MHVFCVRSPQSQDVELQAMSRRVMYMCDWITKLDDFLRLSERDIHTHAGTVSHDDAMAKARREFKRFHVAQINAPSPAEQDFEKAVEEVKRLEVKNANKQSIGDRSRARCGVPRLRMVLTMTKREAPWT